MAISFKQRYKSDSLIGEGAVKFRPYTITEPLPQLATPQNVTADGTVVSWDEVENATSYEVIEGGNNVLGTVENKTEYSLTITNNTGKTISTADITSNNISSISPLESISDGETKTFLIAFTKEFPDGVEYPNNQTYICFSGFNYFDNTGSTFSGEGISMVGTLILSNPTIIFTSPVIFNGSGSVIFNGRDD